MTFAREKRLLLGALALFVAVPLPFNQVLEWPALLLFVAAVAAFLHRARTGSERWLSNRALNLLGLVYLPILALDVAFRGAGQPVRPILHLILFGVAAKLWSLTRERDKWQALVGLFFLFLAAMATSVDPSIVLYLGAFVAVTVLLLVRFVYLHILASFGHRETPPPRLPVAGFVAFAVVATLAIAVPIFALLPRMRQPYIMTEGGAISAQGAATGFSDRMNLDGIGRIRDNPAVVARLDYDRVPRRPDSLRFKAATYEIFEGRNWRRSPPTRRIGRAPGDPMLRLREEPRVASVAIFLEPLRSTSLVLPAEATAVELDRAAVDLDRGGAVILQFAPTELLGYRVELAAEAASIAPPPARAREAALDRGGITPRIAELARRWAGEGSDGARARALADRLRGELEYSTELVGRTGGDVLETFLFETRRGHCELFASALVLLLRAEQIPARLVTGFYGIETSLWDRAYLLRQSSAHAWVEAFVAEEGWITLDPTPAAGLPAIEPASLRRYARQAYEFVLFRWDRYVVSYDFYDQVGLFSGMKSWWDQMIDSWKERRRPSRKPPVVADAGAVDARDGSAAAAPRRGLWLALGGALLAVLAAVGVRLLRAGGPGATAATHYRAARRVVAECGVRVADSTPPFAFLDAARRRLPEAGGAVARLVAIYVEESFDGRTTARAALAEAAAAVAEIERAARARARPARSRPGGSVPGEPAPEGSMKYSSPSHANSEEPAA